MRRAAMMLAGLLVLAACESASEPEIPAFTGTWTGTSSLSGGTFQVRMTTTDNRGTVNGSGTVSVAGNTIGAFTVSGSHVHPDVVLTLVSSGFEDMQFSGEFTNDDTVRGQLDGSGFQSQAVTLSRASPIQ